MKYSNIREEELKNKIAADYFKKFDSTKIIGNIDFCITSKNSKKDLSDIQSLLWAEAKRGKSDAHKSIVQLILTIGKARTFNESLPPNYLGAFDSEKILFIPYSEIQEIFNINDFNWKVTPSNHETKEFKLVLEKVTSIVNDNSYLFNFGEKDNELKNFIQQNFIIDKDDTSKIQIDKNNFINVYNKWLDIVKPTIEIEWEKAKEKDIIPADFYLADLLSLKNDTKEITDKLFVLLIHDHYLLDRQLDETMLVTSKKARFNDDQKAHTQFWNKYKRPPRREYWDYLVERRDLLVPQDIRERKGSFFTPQIWVELSQKYLSDVLGEDWQEEYIIWDCAAGTGNLLAGLTNEYNIWASTIDQADVDVMKERLQNGVNLLAGHVFQFDFLNDDFSKLPENLKKIIDDPEKRKKLVIYINPPYADASSNFKTSGKEGNSFTRTHQKYKDELGNFAREIYSQFLVKIYFEIPGCIIGEFSKLKLLSVSHAKKMRNFFLAKIEKMFIVPSYTFDNVKGEFPIGFKIWNTNIKKKFEKISTNLYDKNSNFIGKKNIYSYDNLVKINKWLSKHNSLNDTIGYISMGRNDFQNNNIIYITSSEKNATNFYHTINKNNLFIISIYFSVQKCVAATWINDRDQFLYPNDDWKMDNEFQSDCLTYTLFKNNIQSKYGTNHWIPFTEQEIDAREKFDSHFMTDFIAGKLKTLPQKDQQEMITEQKQRRTPLEFSPLAKEVFEAGKELWRYYHEQSNCNVNASFYDIREYFQGRNDKGKMNHKSNDQKYMQLITALRQKLKTLENKIAPKVYEYGFLKR